MTYSTVEASPADIEASNPKVRPSDWRFAIPATALFATFVIFLVFHHEPWLDEADSWLAARDMSPMEIYPWLRCAGTPGLWYATLMPFAKAGLPYLAQQLVHAAFAIGVAWIVASRAPFSRLVRGLLIFSYHLSIGYAVIARSYVLTTLLLLLLTVIYTRHKDRNWLFGGLLFLLANTNVHGFMIANVILSAWTVEVARRVRRSRYGMGGLLLAMVGSLLAFAQILPMADGQVIGGTPNWLRFDGFMLAFFPALSNLPSLPLQLQNNELLAAGFTLIRMAAIALIIVTAASAVRNQKAILYVLIASTAALFYVFIFKWYRGERHAGLLFVLVVCLAWVGEDSLKRSGLQTLSRFEQRIRAAAQFAWVLSLAVSTLVAGFWGYRDIVLPYSGGKRVAEFIRSSSLEKEPIAIYSDAYADPVLPFLDRSTKFWKVGRQSWGTYTIWDKELAANWSLPEEEIIQRIDRQFPDARCYLLTAWKPLNDAQVGGYKLIYQTPGPVIVEDEVYFLYAPVPGYRSLRQTESQP